MALETEQRFIREKIKTLQGIKGFSEVINNFIIILIKYVISNKIIYVLWLPEHEIHPNILCARESQSQQVEPFTISLDMWDLLLKTTKNILDKNTSAFLNMVVQLKTPEFFKI